MQDKSASGVVKDRSDTAKAAGSVLIVNADDWGCNRETTDRVLVCARQGAISSVSVMVHMEDSERSAALAREHGVDAGLHLNFTLGFDGGRSWARLNEQQARLGRFLTLHRYAPTVYHPGLARAFDYVTKAQLDEYERLYGAAPRRIDGHQHMHLCSNVILQGLLPVGTIVRRNFTFATGERAWPNRVYRGWQDRKLAQQHPMADCFFNLVPADPERLERICSLGKRCDVEVETHVIRDDEYRFLMDGGFGPYAGGTVVAQGYVLRGGAAGKMA